MSFRFTLFDDEDGKGGELHSMSNELYVTKWFWPRKIKNGFTISDNKEPYNSNVFEKFIKDIKNDTNCKYYRDDEMIFEYRDGVFIVNPESMQTGLNFDSRYTDFGIVNKKEEVLEVLTEIHNWLKGINIDSYLINSYQS